MKKSHKTFKKFIQNKFIFGLMLLVSLSFIVWACSAEEENPDPVDFSRQLNTVDIYVYDELSHTDTYTYDDKGKLTKVTSKTPEGDTWNMEVVYNEEGYMMSYENTTSWGYDYKVEVTATTAEGKPSEASYTYRDNGTLTNSGTFTYEYDAEGKLSKNIVDGNVQVSFEYNANDKLSKVSRPTFTIDLSYDSNDNFNHAYSGNAEYNDQSKPNWSLFDGNYHYFYDFTNGLTVGWQYNSFMDMDKQLSNNLFTGFAYPDGSVEKSIRYEYDDQNRPIKAFDEIGETEIQRYEITYVE